MRLLSFETAGQRRLGAELDGRIVDLTNAAALLGAPAVPADMLAFLAGGAPTMAAAREALARMQALPAAAREALGGASAVLYRAEQVRRLAPVPRPGKVVCLGLNYRDHAAETGLKVPEEPVLFAKFSTAVTGPGEAILLPPDSEEVDYEAELVFVIGRGGRNIPEAEALDHVAGYTCGNDVSARDYQLRRGGGQWLAGKTWETFAPMGPVLVTTDELPDPNDLAIACRVNGETLQQSRTREFVFTVQQVVAYLSRICTLEPGDAVFTGTPPGVGFVRKPPVFLKAGDSVEVEIEAIGVLRNPVRTSQ